MKRTILIFYILFIWLGSSFANADGKVDSLIKIYKSNIYQNDPNKSIDILTKIGAELNFNYPDSATYYFAIALDLAKNEANNNYEAELLNRIGSVKYRQGEYDQSLNYFLKALNICRSTNDKNGIAVGLNNVAMILNMLDKKEEAIKNHINSALLCEEIGDSVLLAANYFNIGLVNLGLGNYDIALAYVKKSSSINALINKRDITYELNTLEGNIYLEKGEYLLAEKAFLKVVNKVEFNNKWEMS